MMRFTAFPGNPIKPRHDRYRDIGDIRDIGDRDVGGVGDTDAGE